MAPARDPNTGTPQPPGPLAVLRLYRDAATVTVLAEAGDDTALASRTVLVAGRTDQPSVCTRLAMLVAETVEAVGLRPTELTGGLLVADHRAEPGTGGPATGSPAGDGPAGDSPVAQAEDPCTPQQRCTSEELTNLTGQLPVWLAERAPPRTRRPVRASIEELATRPAPVPENGRPPLGTGVLAEPVRAHRWPAIATGFGMSLVTALVTLLGSQLPGWHASRPTGPAPAGTDGMLAQYDYALVLPAGWRQSGGLPARRRTLLTPVVTPEGSDLISVEQTPLGYDSAAEPDRAFRELRTRYEQARDAGAELDRFTLSTRVAGRDLIGYHQRQPLRGAEVDWYVLFQRADQLSVGCQHTPAGTLAVHQACAEVIGSLRLVG